MTSSSTKRDLMSHKTFVYIKAPLRESIVQQTIHYMYDIMDTNKNLLFRIPNIEIFNLLYTGLVTTFALFIAYNFKGRSGTHSWHLWVQKLTKFRRSSLHETVLLKNAMLIDFEIEHFGFFLYRWTVRISLNMYYFKLLFSLCAQI